MPFNLSLLQDQQYQQDQQDQQDQQTIPFNVCSMIPANSAGIINVIVDPNTNLCNIDNIQIQNILGDDYFQQSRDLFLNNLLSVLLHYYTFPKPAIVVSFLFKIFAYVSQIHLLTPQFVEELLHSCQQCSENELNNIENEFSRLTINVNDSQFKNFINHLNQELNKIENPFRALRWRTHSLTYIKKKNSIHYICFFLLYITEKYKITTIKNFLISIYGVEKSFSQIFKGLTRAHRMMQKRYETT